VRLYFSIAIIYLLNRKVEGLTMNFKMNNSKEIIADMKTLIHKTPENGNPVTFMAFTDDFVDLVFEKYSGYAVVVYEDDAPIAGGIVWKPNADKVEGLSGEFDFSDDELENFAQIDNTVVLPEFRGHGLQKKMIALLEEKAREWNSPVIVATAAPSNVASVSSFLSNDWKIERKITRHGGVERNLLKKELNDDCEMSDAEIARAFDKLLAEAHEHRNILTKEEARKAIGLDE
jgi:GNAT superfamily N-acetyltransferase